MRPLALFTALLAAGCNCGSSSPSSDAGADAGEIADAGNADAGTSDAGMTTVTQTFLSDATWSVTDAQSTSVGFAQLVCPSTSQPSCPSGATVYGLPNAVWATDLSAIPGANWIWAPGITGATPNASLARYSFSKVFHLPGTPASGHIFISVDDFAEVVVNGTPVGSIGSVTDVTVAFSAQHVLHEFDLLPLLVSGDNTIVINAQNGPDSFAQPNSTYAQNVAGVVFGGSLSDERSSP